MLGGGQAFYFRGEGNVGRANARGLWGREREWGSWGWGGGSYSPLPISYMVSMGSSVCKLPPSEVRGGAWAAKRFSCILKAPDGLPWNLFGLSSGEHNPFALPLNPPIPGCLKTCPVRIFMLTANIGSASIKTFHDSCLT